MRYGNIDQKIRKASAEVCVLIKKQLIDLKKPGYKINIYINKSFALNSTVEFFLFVVQEKQDKLFSKRVDAFEFFPEPYRGITRYIKAQMLLFPKTSWLVVPFLFTEQVLCDYTLIQDRRDQSGISKLI